MTSSTIRSKRKKYKIKVPFHRADVASFFFRYQFKIGIVLKIDFAFFSMITESFRFEKNVENPRLQIFNDVMQWQ